MPELGDRALEQRVRGGAGGVGLGSGRAQLLGGELRGRLDDHRLLVGRGQVEQAAGRRRRSAGPGVPRPGHLGERAARRADGAEARPAGLVDRPLGGPAGVEPVEHRGLRELGEHGKARPHHIPSAPVATRHRHPHVSGTGCTG